MSKPEVTIYTKFGCGFCSRAKRLLDEKGVEYTEHDITMGGPKRAEKSREPQPSTATRVRPFTQACGVHARRMVAVRERPTSSYILASQLFTTT